MPRNNILEYVALAGEYLDSGRGLDHNESNSGTSDRNPIETQSIMFYQCGVVVWYTTLSSFAQSTF